MSISPNVAHLGIASSSEWLGLSMCRGIQRKKVKGSEINFLNIQRATIDQ